MAPPSIVMDPLIVTAPKSPGLNTEITPPGDVALWAAENVAHGCVTLQGFASLPYPATQVCAEVAAAGSVARKPTAMTAKYWR
jgi:hypothetical protein